MPHEIIRSGVAYFFPKVEQRITRTLTMPRTATFASARSGTGSIGPGKPVPYVSYHSSSFCSLRSRLSKLELTNVLFPSFADLVRRRRWEEQSVQGSELGAAGRVGRSRVSSFEGFDVDRSVGESFVHQSSPPFLASDSTLLLSSVSHLHPTLGMDHLLALHRSKRSIQRRFRKPA